MNPIRSIISLLMLAASAACVSKPSAVDTAPGPARWSGSFRVSQMAATAVVGPATPGKTAAFGAITLVALDSTPPTTRVELSISAPVTAGTQVGWAVFSGPCGTPSPPLAGPHEFPTIEIANSGSGLVRTVMAIGLDPRRSYHANVYWASQVTDVSNVMMCANVTVSGR
jgi:hypothetical protein